MIITDKQKLLTTEYHVEGPGWSSTRMLVRKHAMGFSVNDTWIKAGACLTLEYKNHLEACYCIEGHGRITDHATQETHEIYPGVLYALDKHDKHTFTADETTDVRLISVFNPALHGTETHNPDGSYSA